MPRAGGASPLAAMGGAPAESPPSSSEGQAAGSDAGWEWFAPRMDAIDAFIRELARTRGITLDSALAAPSPLPPPRTIEQLALKLAYERGATSAARPATSVAAPLPLPVRPVSSEGAPTPAEEVAAEVRQLQSRIAALRDERTQALMHTGPPPWYSSINIFNELFHPNISASFQKGWRAVRLPVALGNLQLPAMVGTTKKASTGTKELVQVESGKQFVRPLHAALVHIANGTLPISSESSIGQWRSGLGLGLG